MYWGMKLKGRGVHFQLLYVPKYHLSICKKYGKQKTKNKLKKQQKKKPNIYKDTGRRMFTVSLFLLVRKMKKINKELVHL